MSFIRSYNKIFIIFLSCYMLSSCTLARYLASTLSHSSNSGTDKSWQVNTRIGNDDYTGTSKTMRFDNAKNNEIIINENNFWELIGFLIVGSALASLFFYYLPRPKHADKIAQALRKRKELKKKINNTNKD